MSMGKLRKVTLTKEEGELITDVHKTIMASLVNFMNTFPNKETREQAAINALAMTAIALGYQVGAREHDIDKFIECFQKVLIETAKLSVLVEDKLVEKDFTEH